MANMKRSIAKPALAALASIMLSACASDPSGAVADLVPMWLGGMPKDVPPRRGTPEYEAWQKKRADDAAAIKPK